MRILGIDPGLQKTGWGIIDSADNRLSFVACGTIKTNSDTPLFSRLCDIDQGLSLVMKEWAPEEAAIEETFMNNNAASALKLGMARGVAMVVPARGGLYVAEYAANLIKKSIVGTGHADKGQIGMMVKTLLPLATFTYADEADALAIAICHAHHRQANFRVRTA